MNKNTFYSALVLSLLLVSAFSIIGMAQLERKCPNCVPPERVTCPQGYETIRIRTDIGRLTLCKPTGGPDPEPEPQQDPPPLSSLPQVPEGGPESMSPPPGEPEGRAFQQQPPGPPVGIKTNQLFVQYRGRLQKFGYTRRGGSLPVFVKLAASGRLTVREHYFRSGRTNTYGFGRRPAGWTKFWFTGDTSGWHVLISKVNGVWSQWIWIYVS